MARKTEVAGYAVVGKTGDIWELSYNPKEDAKEIVRQLLSWATNYAQEVGGDSVVLNEYAKDQVIREVCQELEFVEAPSEQVFASVLDLQQLILSILQSKKGAFEVEGAFRFNLRNCPSWCKNSIVLRRGKNGFSLAEENALKEDFSMDVDMQTLVEIIFGTKTPTEALFASEVHARPFWKIRKCLSLLSLLKTDLPWVVPKADIG